MSAHLDQGHERSRAAVASRWATVLVLAGLATLVGRDEVKIVESVDPEIIGGVVAKVGDRLVDGSTRTQLRAMRDSLADRPVD